MALGITVCIGDPFPHSSKNIPPPSFLPVPPPPPQDLDFSVNPQNIKDFFVLHPTLSYLLKVIKFLVKISQFEFLVMTEKNIFGFKLFLTLNISDFNLLFIWNLQAPHLYPGNPPLTVEVLSCAPHF